MNLPSPSIPSIIAKHRIRIKKSLGQNFLSDANILERIVQAAEIPSDATVLEIGAGLGTLTYYLALSSQHVIAVEIDRKLKPAIQDMLSELPNTTLIFDDILKLKPEEIIGDEEFLVVANIPFYITSKLFRHLLGASKKPIRLVLTVQKEVAQRICAEPGRLSLLALSIQVYGVPRIMMRIPAGAFFPVPKVDSAVVRVDLHPQPLIPIEHLDIFFRLAKAGFSQKRKKMRNALSAGMSIKPDRAENLLILAGIDPASRAQMLDFDDWGKLVNIWLEKQNN